MLISQPKPRSMLSIDVGQKRIGLAGCDALGITICPLPAIKRGNFSKDLHDFRKHCDSRNVQGLIVGLPLDDKGCPTIQTNYCEKYGQRLAKELHLPLALVNEHSSSWEASTRFNLYGDRSGRLDSAAAILLIEQWLREGPEPTTCKVLNTSDPDRYVYRGSCLDELEKS